LNFTTALWIYFGIWPAVTVKFRADQIEPGGFLSMGECLVFTRRKWTGRCGKEKADRTRSGFGCCSENNHTQQPKPLDVSGWRSITLPRNLSVTANFLRTQSGVKKKCNGNKWEINKFDVCLGYNTMGINCKYIK